MRTHVERTCAGTFEYIHQYTGESGPVMYAQGFKQERLQGRKFPDCLGEVPADVSG